MHASQSGRGKVRRDDDDRPRHGRLGRSAIASNVQRSRAATSAKVGEVSATRATSDLALSAAVCRRLGFNDIGLRAYPYLARTIDKLATTERPDVVFITGSPFYPMLLARRIERQFRIPVVLDFQDPWVSAQGGARRPGSKAWLAHRVAVTLEPLAVRHAAYVTAVSDIQNDEMAARYPWLDRQRMAGIPIGGDPEDFAALRAAPVASEVRLDPAFFNFSYVGTFLPRAGPLVEQLFAALAELRRGAPDLAARLRLHFIGTSNQPDGAGGARVLPYARAAGVAELVREVPRRLPYLEALSLIARSNALLLIGSDEPHYTASKIYPALLSGRPYLSLFHAASSAHQILSVAGGGRSIAFENTAELPATTAELADGMRAIATAPEALGPSRLEVMEPFLATAVAGRFAEIFDRVSPS